MKIRCTKLTMRNFLSVGNVTQAINLDQDGLTLVLGANMDTQGGVTRNGAGKTTILQAIRYAIYGQPMTKIKVDNLINNVNGKGMLVTIEFERDDGTRFRIERGRKPNILRFFVNGTETAPDVDESLGENRHTQEDIERVIGLPSILFNHLVALNTYTEPFLRMKAADQREVFETLLGQTQISARAESLKKLVSQTKEAIREQELTIKAIQEANQRIEAAIAAAEKESTAWERKHAAQLSELADQIEAVSSVDFEAEIAAFDAVDAWDAILRKLNDDLDAVVREEKSTQRERDLVRKERDTAIKRAEAADTQHIDRLEDQRKRVERDRKTLVAQTTKANQDRERLATMVERAAVDLERATSDVANANDQDCVCCGQPLAGTDHLASVIANLEQKREECEAALTSARADLAALAGKLETLAKDDAALAADVADLIERIDDARAQAKDQAAERLSAMAEFDGQIVALDDRLAALAATRAGFQTRITDLGSRPETLFASRDEAYRARQMHDALVHERATEEAKINPHAAQADSLKQTIQTVDYEPLNDHTHLLKHQEFLLKLLTSKDSFIRKKIIAQNLSYLNHRVNHYLDKMNLPHEVTFMPDLTVEITLLGKDYDFEQLSRGEMNRVILATSFAFRDIWESLNSSLNLIFVDESLDQGTDGAGCEAAVGILKAFSRNRKSVYLISHREELIARADNVIEVRKINAFTTFENSMS